MGKGRKQADSMLGFEEFVCGACGTMRVAKHHVTPHKLGCRTTGLLLYRPREQEFFCFIEIRIFLARLH